MKRLIIHSVEFRPILVSMNTGTTTHSSFAGALRIPEIFRCARCGDAFLLFLYDTHQQNQSTKRAKPNRKHNSTIHS
jgi:hypothetical protein